MLRSLAFQAEVLPAIRALKVADIAFYGQSIAALGRRAPEDPF